MNEAGSPPARSDEFSRVRALLEIGGLVVAPAAVVSGLLFYFGWVRARAQFAVFGIDQSVLGFSSRDYVFRSIGSVYWALVALFVVGLLAVATRAVVSELGRRGEVRGLRGLGSALLVSGIGLFVVGIVAVERPPAFWDGLIFGPLCLAAGIPLMAFGASLVLDAAQIARRARTGGRSPRTRTATFALVGGLVVACLFWAVGDWAAVRGRRMAEKLAAGIETQPTVVVYSERRLYIDADGVDEIALPADSAGGAYRYRYDGLRLLIRSGGKYFLVPATWTAATGTTIVLPDVESLRFEFAAS